jgi:hypothetical protein
MGAAYIRDDERWDTQGAEDDYCPHCGTEFYGTTECLNPNCDAYDKDLYDEPEIDDDFPMSVEYDGLWGGSDFQDEITAQRETEFEAVYFRDDY